jgi:hypothetical protein
MRFDSVHCNPGLLGMCPTAATVMRLLTAVRIKVICRLKLADQHCVAYMRAPSTGVGGVVTNIVGDQQRMLMQGQVCAHGLVAPRMLA